MEIPYTVSARSDTGLWNAKIGIWLFLASEVMLFGGLFSGYVFLRLGADYPWPNHELNVVLGFVNTVILILSSVFVVLAWAGLKMREYGKYKMWMTGVVVCALVFLVNKTFEYKAKFEHKAVVLKDRSVLAGHLPDGSDPNIRFMAKYATVDFATGNYRFLKFIGDEVKFIGPKGEVAMDRDWFLEHRAASQLKGKADFLAGAAAEAEGKAAEETGDAAQALRDRAASLEAESAKLLAELKEKYPEFEEFEGSTSMRFELQPEAEIRVPRSEIVAWSDNDLTFKDSTKVEGLLQSATLQLEVDEIDLRVFLQPDRSGMVSNDVGSASALKYLPAPVREAFEHRRSEKLAAFETQKAEWEGRHAEEEYPAPRFRSYDRFMLKDLHAEDGGGHATSGESEDRHGVGGGESSPAGGGEHGAAAAGHAHPVVEIPYEDIRFYSSYTPRKNTYYAIYFTMTGLHALHVFGGMLVLAYFLVFGRSLYRQNPEHLANRVEVGGLFWHFVDLVWIFLFPILYLM